MTLYFTHFERLILTAIDAADRPNIQRANSNQNKHFSVTLTYIKRNQGRDRTYVRRGKSEFLTVVAE